MRDTPGFPAPQPEPPCALFNPARPLERPQQILWTEDGPVSSICTGNWSRYSLIRKHLPLGPYRRPMPRVPGGSWGVGRFLMGEVPLYARKSGHPVPRRPWRGVLVPLAPRRHHWVARSNNLPGQWLQCQANGSIVCRVLTASSKE